MKVNAEIGKTRIEVSASEDEEIINFGKFTAMVIMTVCHIENERKEFESLPE